MTRRTIIMIARSPRSPGSPLRQTSGTSHAIENKLHWVRNTLITAFRLTGWHNLKQARRHFSHAISQCVDLITKPAKTVKIKHDRALDIRGVGVRGQRLRGGARLSRLIQAQTR
jgi:hypothetical protein